MEYVGAGGADLRHYGEIEESRGHIEFQLGEIVEGLWWGSRRRGKIVEILEGSTYMVLIDGEKEATRFDSSNLRVRVKWDGGSLALSQHKLQEKISSTETNRKGLKLKFKPIKKPRETIFARGAMVEVKTDQEGFEGAWYNAIIVGSVGDGKFLIQYETIVTEDNKHFLQEVAEEMNIRPRPPEKDFHQFKASDRVDVRYNEGWWEGVVSQILDDSSCTVYFPTTQETIMYMFNDLRPHHDWVNGQWYGTFGSKEKSSSTHESNGERSKLKFKLIEKPQNTACFRTGARVEVRTDQEGYEGAWYTAIIVGSAGDSKFIVEYETIVTEDHRHFVQEVAEEVNIRPRPPDRKVFHMFEVSQRVDVWYNEGWWEGVVFQVLGDSSYGVYFPTTREEMMLDFSELRIHEDWVNGEWVGTAASNVPYYRCV